MHDICSGYLHPSNDDEAVQALQLRALVAAYAGTCKRHSRLQKAMLAPGSVELTGENVGSGTAFAMPVVRRYGLPTPTLQALDTTVPIHHPAKQPPRWPQGDCRVAWQQVWSEPGGWQHCQCHGRTNYVSVAAGEHVTRYMMEGTAYAWQYGKPKNRPGVGATFRVSSGESLPSWSIPLLVKYSFPSASQSKPTVLRMPGNRTINQQSMDCSLHILQPSAGPENRKLCSADTKSMTVGHL